MLISLGLPTSRLPASPELATGAAIASISRAAEAAGYDAVFVTDHPFPSAKWVQRGGHHATDPFVTLSFAAAATTTLRLQTNLLVLGYRNPFVTAHAVASLDSISGGRLIVGVGAGYSKPEFDALGATFEGRGALMDNALRMMDAAWNGTPIASADGSYALTDNVMQPLPTQRPRPPILVGGNSTAAIRRAVTLADGWIPMPSPAAAARLLGTPGIETVNDLRERIALAHRLGAEAGRTAPLHIWFTPFGLSGFDHSGWDAAALTSELDELAALGVEGVTITLPGNTVDEFRAALETFAAAVIA